MITQDKATGNIGFTAMLADRTGYAVPYTGHFTDHMRIEHDLPTINKIIGIFEGVSNP